MEEKLKQIRDEIQAGTKKYQELDRRKETYPNGCAEWNLYNLMAASCEGVVEGLKQALAILEKR